MTAAPRVVRHGGITLFDYEPSGDHLCEEAVRGLLDPRKHLPPKYFYDERGGRLFDQICALEAYYPTRTELAILRKNIGEIAERLGSHVRLVEFGSGSGLKTRLLLEHLQAPAAYVPIDISHAQLVEFARATAERYPTLRVTPVSADYTVWFELPPPQRDERRTVGFFPGSTIGNFEPEEAARFLGRVAHLCGPDGGLLIGIDLRKDPAVIERAYNDPEGITAEFNLNLLARLNRECGTDFHLSTFRHDAFFDEKHGRIEMRLVSRCPQTVHFPSGEEVTTIVFAEGEPITTEYSYKYTADDFDRLAASAGWELERQWTDEQQWFSVRLLRRS